MTQSNRALTFQKVTIVGGILLLLSWIIAMIQRTHFLAMFFSGVSLRKQLVFGLIVGTGVAGLCSLGIYFSTQLWAFIKEIFGGALPAIPSMIGMSLIAGFTEEIFFRGTLQPIIGLWLASLLFVLVHFGHGHFGWARVVYLLFVFCYGTLLGLMFESLGLAAAITAHTTFDFILLVALRWMRADRIAGDQTAAPPSATPGSIHGSRSGVQLRKRLICLAKRPYACKAR